ncbi:MAG: response regulator [Candidatus Marinimicrobia bacterium]|jgi:signal transduction histidine kinase/CheY-like chemotaxis protein/HAMP domain-containing protein|nr:response regulator [Candidatus Neomarinimicrobiota bacterium]MBT3632695.1 response regulator [Candidatus Neomarinimicrobiota bacterium]MBT3823537.1 response regulator [Candidatus Neomarinimicrobiota bacterium]MBT4129619.1 response regulator [Candidatus Neomarinimicrobiota bacterium]MBT4294564.1 response regulator [Candidatus Neomarinimicrobiota bacterium]
MKKFMQFKKTQTRLLTWFLVIGIVPLLISTFIISQQRIGVIKSNQFQKLVGIRDLKVREINNWLGERIGDISTIAGDFEIIDYSTNVFHSPKAAHTADLMEVSEQLFQRYLENYNDYNEVFIVSAKTGKILVSTDQTAIGSDKKNDVYFTQALESEALFIKDIYRSSSRGYHPEMTFSVPIMCNLHDSHPVGVVVVRIDLDRSLYDLLLNRTGMGQTGETLIINQQMMALNELRHYEDAPLNLEIAAEPARRGVAGLTGIIEVEDYRQEPVLAAYSHISAMGWGFVAKQDQAEVYASIDRLYRSIVIIALLVSLGIIILSLFFAKSTTKPILNMVAASKRMIAGDFSVRTQVGTSDETAGLGLSINNLAATIESQNEVRGGIGLISDAIVSANSLEDFSKQVLQTYLTISQAQFGAFYIRDKHSDKFEPLTSFGFETEKLLDFDIDAEEGEFAKVFSTKQVVRIKKIPEDTIFLFKTVYGSAVPREIVNIPILVRDEVFGILTLASLRSCSDNCIEIINQSLINLCTGFSNILAEENTRQIASELVDKNQELESLAEELQSQTEELQEQNVELDAQRHQVEEANRLKSEFLSNMSHELRTPLNSIMALSNVLVDQSSDRLSGDESEYLEIIARNGRHLLKLINDILDLSKIEAGQMEIMITTFSLTGLIDDIVEGLRPLANENGNDLNINMIENLPDITSDQSLVHRIIQNLIGNAVKFTENGLVTLTIKQNSAAISISIQDTGIGISSEALPMIFDEFRQADGSTSRHYGGTGLGLAIAQRSAHLIGGELNVKSQLGEGSTFTFTLPKSTPKLHTSMQIPPVVSATKRSKQLVLGRDQIRLLIVEDQEPAIIQLESILEPIGYTLDIVRNGRMALDYLEKTTPDGIILDLMLPEVDGFDVLRSVRANQSTSNVPILVLTSKSLTADELEKLRYNNIQQLIQKGDVNKKELIDKIGSILQLDPVSSEPEVQKVAAASKREKSTQSQTEMATILIIESNADSLIALKAVFGDDYALLEAMDGEKGWELFQSEKPDIVLLDIVLPKLDGYAIARKAKAHLELKDIPIIAISAKAMKGDREKILAAGCDDSLSKPIDMQELKAKISELINH